MLTQRSSFVLSLSEVVTQERYHEGLGSYEELPALYSRYYILSKQRRDARIVDNTPMTVVLSIYFCHGYNLQIISARI